MYANDVDLKDFFDWAAITMLDLDTFFKLAEYEAIQYDLDAFCRLYTEAPNYDLDNFFESNKYPEAPNYDLGEFFESNKYPEAPNYDLHALVEFYKYPQALKYELDVFFDRAMYPEASQYELDSFFQQVPCFQSRKLLSDGSAAEKEGIYQICLKRSGSCSWEIRNPLKKRSFSAPSVTKAL